jgi:hypothetical protein
MKLLGMVLALLVAGNNGHYVPTFVDESHSFHFTWLGEVLWMVLAFIGLLIVLAIIGRVFFRHLK